jgi:hypothetical protein
LSKDLKMSEGWLPKGLRVSGKRQLITILRDWLHQSGAATIGDTSRFHGSFWVYVDVNGHRVRLAADTTREAVQRLVDEVGAHPERPWRVVANQLGRINKVVVVDRDDPGWYAYLSRPLDVETEI